MKSKFVELVEQIEFENSQPITDDVFCLVINEEISMEIPVIEHNDRLFVLEPDQFVYEFLKEENLFDEDDNKVDVDYNKLHQQQDQKNQQDVDKRMIDASKPIDYTAPERPIYTDPKLKNLRPKLQEAEYQGRQVSLGKPMAGDVKKYKVYVKDPSTGNVKKVNFGDKKLSIKRDNPGRRKNFRARHRCATAKDRTSARYWSCRFWSKKPVSQILKGK